MRFQIGEPVLRSIDTVADASNLRDVLVCLFEIFVRARIDPKDSPVADVRLAEVEDSIQSVLRF